MIKKVDGSGAGEFSIGSGQSQPALDKLSYNTSKVGQFVTTHTRTKTSYTLKGHTIDPSFKGADYLQSLQKRRAKG